MRFAAGHCGTPARLPNLDDLQRHITSVSEKECGLSGFVRRILAEIDGIHANNLNLADGI
jgi:hypothetical protein